MNKFFHFFRNMSVSPIILVMMVQSSSFAQNQCENLFLVTKVIIPSIKKVKINENSFRESTELLKSTLSGKLATVWRSEWKTKISILNSNQYVHDMLKNFLTTKTYELVTENLNVQSEKFTRDVHERLYELQKKNLINSADDISVRDAPTDKGIYSTTFTYYTKAITNAEGMGKHQVRVRTYVNKVQMHELEINKLISGYNQQGQLVEVIRQDQTHFKIKISKNDELISETIKEFKESENLYLLAAHGKSLKLEVKSALEDKIKASEYPLMAGDHMVQKLDVNLTLPQFQELFSPLKSEGIREKIIESNLRIEKISAALIAKKPETKNRVDAVFNVIKLAIRSEPDFLTIEGATQYNRTAFESRSGFQTTIDRDQGIYLGNMYSKDKVLNPFEVINTNPFLKTGLEDSKLRHVELKVPVTSIKNALGINFNNPKNAPAPANVDKDPQILSAIKIYYKFLSNDKHNGKFSFTIQNTENFTD